MHKGRGSWRRKSKPAPKKEAVKKPAPKSPIARAAAKRGNTTTATSKNYDAAPGKTNPNPRMRAQSLTRDKTGSVQTKGGTYNVYKKDSSAAKSFRSAFSDARKAGKKTFTWNGKKYTTEQK